MESSLTICLSIPGAMKFLDYPLKLYDKDIIRSLISSIYHSKIKTRPDTISIARNWVETKKLQCRCFRFNTDEYIGSFVHGFRVLKIPITCEFVNRIREYRVQLGIYPSKVALATYISKVRASFLARISKVITKHPTDNLCHLPITKSTGIHTCTLCQGSITPLTEVYRMPCCKQFFHKSKTSCLGDKNIITWLREHDKCAVCGSNVVIDIPEPDTNKSRKRKLSV